MQKFLGYVSLVSLFVAFGLALTESLNWETFVTFAVLFVVFGFSLKNLFVK